MPNDQLGYRGAADATSGGSPYSENLFLIHQVLAAVSTAKLVRVEAVTNAGDLSPVGFVDVLPLVNQLDGENNAVPHGVVHNIPYFRLQGGTNAVILDPQVGDIGLCIFADRDISAVKNAKEVANPGSKRRFDMADGLYLGGYLNGMPVQYVRFSAAGIDIVSPTQIRLAAPNIVLQATQNIGLTAGTEITNSAPAIEMDGQMTQGEGPLGGSAAMQGPLTVVQDVTAAGKSVSTHTHHENGAGSNTNPPN
ncbi:hypothetical protein BCh11DRAFT_06485 [Burkholderia sp. Ch1-1]|nr:hypothetical protein BCh11DRAFT_06485 [Burkholderia sp. Ch1-1]